MATPAIMSRLRRGRPVIAYPIGSSGEKVELSAEVLDHFCRHRQMRFWQCEAGGLLFARIEGQRIRIDRATGPRPTDIRTPLSYRADRKAEQREIDNLFEDGLHYVGDWHTHPEPFPMPSGRDLKTMASRVLQSRHQMNGFLFAIVGRASAPDGLTLMVHDGREAHRLRPLAELALEKTSAIGTRDAEQAGGVEP